MKLYLDSYIYAFMLRCCIMHRDNFIFHNKNFIIATTVHHYHKFHITYRYTKQISHKIRDPFPIYVLTILTPLQTKVPLANPLCHILTYEKAVCISELHIMSEYRTDSATSKEIFSSKGLYFDISYSQPPIITMHFKETGLQVHNVVFLYICLTHCNTQLGISESIVYV